MTAPDNEEEEFSHDIFEVFTVEKKKCENKPGKALELSAPPPSIQASASGSSNVCPNTQYQYQSNAEDQQLVSKLKDYLLQWKLSLMTPPHIFAASPTIRKNIVNKLKVRCMETNKYKVVPAQRPPTTVHEVTDAATIIEQPSDFCLPLQELNILVNSSIKVAAILDTGSQIVIIQHDIVQALRAPVNYHQLIEMEGANSTTNWMVGCAKNLTLQVGNVLFKVHVHVIKHMSFSLCRGSGGRATWSSHRVEREMR